MWFFSSEAYSLNKWTVLIWAFEITIIKIEIELNLNNYKVVLGNCQSLVTGYLSVSMKQNKWLLHNFGPCDNLHDQKSQNHYCLLLFNNNVYLTDEYAFEVLSLETRLSICSRINVFIKNLSHMNVHRKFTANEIIKSFYRKMKRQTRIDNNFKMKSIQQTKIYF